MEGEITEEQSSWVRVPSVQQPPLALQKPMGTEPPQTPSSATSAENQWDGMWKVGTALVEGSGKKENH